MTKIVKDISGKLPTGIEAIKAVSFNRSGGAIWKCVCHCGKEFAASSSHLTRKTQPIKSCGCGMRRNGSKHHQWLGEGDISGNWWYNHVLRERKQTARHKLPVSIDVQFGWKLFQKQGGTCALSGVPLQFSSNHSLNTASLDRIDSSKGYEKGNVQFVHKHLNFMKRTYSQDYFIEMCGSVYLKHKD